MSVLLGIASMYVCIMLPPHSFAHDYCMVCMYVCTRAMCNRSFDSFKTRIESHLYVSYSVHHIYLNTYIRISLIFRTTTIIYVFIYLFSPFNRLNSVKFGRAFFFLPHFACIHLNFRFFFFLDSTCA